MKKILKPLIAVVLLTGVFHHSIMAQPGSNEVATTTDRDHNDNSSKWGLLGLLGLLGLIPMKKNEKTGTYSTGNNPQNR